MSSIRKATPGKRAKAVQGVAPASLVVPATQDARIQALIDEVETLRRRVGLLQEELVAQADYATETILALSTQDSSVGGLDPKSRRPIQDVLRNTLSALRLLRSRAGIGRAARHWLAAWRIQHLGAFDATFYLSQREDLARMPLEPVQHYLLYGAAEGLDPSPDFSTRTYLERHADVAASGANPYAHYLAAGQAEGRRIASSRRLRRRAFAGGALRAGDRIADPDVAADLRDAMAVWPLARSSGTGAESLGPYDIRPDDDVIREGLVGEIFMRRFDLDGPDPDFGGAVADLRERLSVPVVSPEVSVIVPVHGALAFTLNCLDALSRHRSGRTFEIVVIDDASRDATPDWLPELPGIVYRRLSPNGGFIAACNAGATTAQGEILVFLNNDTRVVRGWLDALCDSFTGLPQAGLVGSKLFYSDGELQEAGGIVWRDGSAWNYGRNDDPNRPNYSYARQVDYVSGASIALSRGVWEALAGFDPHYAPAYCEDSDLAFRVRAQGLKVWMQPTSRVIHYEGKTSGTDTACGVKAHQVTNQVKFLERWRETLSTHRDNGHEPQLERERHVTRRVLVLDATTPTPDQDAGSVTTTKIIEVFQTLGFKVTFAPVDNFLFNPLYTAALMARGVECLYAPYYNTIEEYLARHGDEFDVVHVFRFSVLRECEPHIRALCPQAKIVFNNMDLHYLRIERQAAIENSPDLAQQAAELKRLELDTMSKADIICVPSDVEAALLAKEALGPPVFVMPFMVDLHVPRAPWAERADIVFLGGFSHTPNADAALWMARTLWPRLRSQLGSARLVLAGANPTPEILALAGQDIIVPGRVNELAPMFERARVFVAPLRYGAGVKGKIYSALTHGVPVVSTSIGAEGMGLVQGEEVLVADQAEAFCREVLAAHGDEALWNRLSKAGTAFIRRNSTLEAGVRVMDEILTIAGVDPAPVLTPSTAPHQIFGLS
jgi:GT2 family glycosyltransferase